MITRTDLAADIATSRDIDHAAAAEAVTVYAEQLGVAPGDLTTDDAEHIRRAIDAHMAHDTSRPLDAVHDATEHLRGLRAAAEEAEGAWKAAIRTAVADGQRVVDVAEAAGISRERVYQIRDDRRR